MNTCSVIRYRPDMLFLFGRLDRLPGCLRRPDVRESLADLSLERLATAFMTNQASVFALVVAVLITPIQVL